MTTGVAAAAGMLLHESGDAPQRKPDAAARLPDYFAAIDFPQSNPRISIAGGTEDRIGQMVRAAVNGLAPSQGMGAFVSSGDVVLIKPNAGFDRPVRLGATTHPEVVRGLLRMCREAGARRIIVTDNPIEDPQSCFARTGIGDVAREEGAEVVLPVRSGFREVMVRQRRPQRAAGEILEHWPMLFEPLAAATKVIGVAPVKDHSLCGASMNLKNWYGLLGGRRHQLHQAIHETISDLAMLISPTLVVADGTRVMMQNGPTGGRISDVQAGGRIGRPVVVAAVDPVACDAWCFENLLGRDPGTLAYLEYAQRKIEVAVSQGTHRFGRCDWREYERLGQIASSGV